MRSSTESRTTPVAVAVAVGAIAVPSAVDPHAVSSAMAAQHAIVETAEVAEVAETAGARGAARCGGVVLRTCCSVPIRKVAPDAACRVPRAA